MKPSKDPCSKINKPSKSLSVQSRLITELPISSSESAFNFPSTSKTIEDIILAKSLYSKSTLAENRQKTKALQLQDLRQAPHLISSKKRIKSLEVLPTAPNSAQIDKKSKKAQKKPLENLKDLKSPKSNSLIDPPDLSNLREMISKITPRPVVNNVKLTDLNIVQKTELLMQKKEEKLIKAKNLKIETDLEPCTFKPDLKKPKSARANSELLNSPKVKTFDKTKKTNQDSLIRIPVPSKSVQFLQQPGPNQHIFLSTHYSQFSPISKIYSFREGANIEELKNRSRQMMTYYVHTNRT